MYENYRNFDVEAPLQKQLVAYTSGSGMKLFHKFFFPKIDVTVSAQANAWNYSKFRLGSDIVECPIFRDVDLPANSVTHLEVMVLHAGKDVNPRQLQLQISNDDLRCWSIQGSVGYHVPVSVVTSLLRQLLTREELLPSSFVCAQHSSKVSAYQISISQDVQIYIHHTHCHCRRHLRLILII